ncbi:MAG: glycosyltransferase [Methylococcales bacterium]|nr:glycosyltransferase [Methylococcales bacterium]MCK5925330.1 glycosyltransferase [Methylococcales bacterium]
MNILFIHQNFPGQFKHLAKKLAEKKQNKVIALRVHKNTGIENVDIYEYPILTPESQNIHPLVKDFETKVRRAESVVKFCNALKEAGFTPDIVIAHAGWGESFFIRDIWAKTKILAYLEYYYRFEGQDVNFDPEFSVDSDQRYRIRLKNHATLQALDEADAFITPTKWQHKQFPKWAHKRIKIIHDGIDLTICCPNENAVVRLEKADITLTKADKVITYVSRGLEPLRGFHQFMRSLPSVMKAHPDVIILVVGNDTPAYESQKGDTYKAQLLAELSGQLHANQLYFLGKVSYENYLQILQISSVHIYLTYPFIASWSLLEAMAMECAVVGSKTAPVTEYIQPHKNGLLVDFFNPQQLAESISLLLNDRVLAQRLGQQARKTIQVRCELTQCLGKQLKLIHSLR